MIDKGAVGGARDDQQVLGAEFVGGLAHQGGQLLAAPALGGVDGEAKQALLVALYRQGKLSHLALCKALGLDRSETEDVLRKHNVTEDLGTVEDYLADAATLAKLRTHPR